MEVADPERSVRNLCQYVAEVWGENNCNFSPLDTFLGPNFSSNDINVGNRPVTSAGPYVLEYPPVTPRTTQAALLGTQKSRLSIT